MWLDLRLLERGPAAHGANLAACPKTCSPFRAPPMPPHLLQTTRQQRWRERRHHVLLPRAELVHKVQQRRGAKAATPRRWRQAGHRQ